jgi:hypothetical protein
MANEKPNKKSEIEFEFIKTKRPAPKGVLQEIAREFEDEAKEKKANKGKQTPSASQKMQNKKREEAKKRIENKKKDKKQNTFAKGVGESNRQKSMRVNMKAGGALKSPANPGLKKLPTEVRNKMGYMKSGGKVGYSKGGIVDRQYLKGR